MERHRIICGVPDAFCGIQQSLMRWLAAANRAENIVGVLRKVQLLHSQNQNEIQYIWDYYWGGRPLF